jgi:hypothetical protein
MRRLKPTPARADRKDMRNHVWVVLLSALLVLAGSRPAEAQQTPVAELGMMFWKPTPELRLSTDALAAADVNEVDFVQEFGIEDKYFPEFRLTLGRKHKFRTSFVTFNYTPEAIITRRITFRGQTFNIGAPAAADIKWKLYRFGYEWDIVSGGGGFVGLVADLKYNRVEASIDSPLLSAAAATDVTAPIPTIGGIGRGYLSPNVSITAEFSGINIGRDADEGKLYDFDLYGTVTAGRNFGVQAGYRSVIVDYVVDSDSGVLKMKGLYLGAAVRF